MLPFFHCIILPFFSKLCVCVGVWVNIRLFVLISLVNLFVFMSIPNCFDYCSSVIELDDRDGDASGSSFIVQDFINLKKLKKSRETSPCTLSTNNVKYLGVILMEED